MKLRFKFTDLFFVKTIIAQFFRKRWDQLFGRNKKFKTKILNPQAQYEWRGLMIDTVRHMSSLAYLKKTLEKMSELGLNRLHLHLSDDQGFRLESKKYPKLNEIGSYRKETAVEKNFPTGWSPFKKFLGDGKRYGGYYTQDEIKDLVKLSREKGIEIVPEIDIPGHATAMIASYPDLSAKKDNSLIETSCYWGVHENVFSGERGTIEFLKNLFDEVCDVFDAKYIHIGGDEVSLKNYNGDESVPEEILLKITEHIKSKNIQVIMWDEASKIALKTDSIVMAWRSLEAGMEHLKKGGRVIFSPTSYFYFDFYQKENKSEPLAIGGYLPIEKVYSFRIDDSSRKKYFSRILGVQANLWTEYMQDEKQMDYMLYPRIYALAEVAKGTNVDFEKFKERIREKI